METNYPAPGKPVKGVLQNGDVSSATAVNLYDERDGSSVSLGSDEYLLVTQLVVSPRSSGRFTVFLDADGNGTAAESEIIYIGSLDAQANNVPVPDKPDYKAGFRGRDGAKPKVLADSAIGVDVLLAGFIRKSISKSGPV